MPIYEVKRVIELRKFIEAESREEALDYFDEHDADMSVIRETAKPVRGHKPHDPFSYSPMGPGRGRDW